MRYVAILQQIIIDLQPDESALSCLGDVQSDQIGQNESLNLCFLRNDVIMRGDAPHTVRSAIVRHRSKIC
jgi:hypothetical protein